MIEIKELVIRAVIDTSDNNQRNVQNNEASPPSNKKDFEEIINEVLETIKEKNER